MSSCRPLTVPLSFSAWAASRSAATARATAAPSRERAMIASEMAMVGPTQPGTAAACSSATVCNRHDVLPERPMAAGGRPARQW